MYFQSSTWTELNANEAFIKHCLESIILIVDWPKVKDKIEGFNSKGLKMQEIKWLLGMY